MRNFGVACGDEKIGNVRYCNSVSAPERCHCEERSDAAIRFPAFVVAAPERRFNR